MDELERLGLDDDFGVAYDNEAMQKRMINTARNWGYDDGKADGLEEETKTERIAIANNLLKNGISIDLVSENTGLSVEDLEELKKEV